MEPLKPIGEAISPDGRWQIYGSSLADLHSRVAGMDLDQQVPERVLIQFQQAQHLLIYSFYQFSLLSVAMMQAHVALEAALEDRWWGARGGKPFGHCHPIGLRRLLKEARLNGWLPDLADDFPDAAAKTRNDLAHGAYALDPWHTLHVVKKVGQMIKTVFADSTDTERGPR